MAKDLFMVRPVEGNCGRIQVPQTLTNAYIALLYNLPIEKQEETVAYVPSIEQYKTCYFKGEDFIGNPGIQKSVKDRLERAKLLFSTIEGTTPEDINVYRTFKIPKRSGGFRTISAPTEQKKMIQAEMVRVLRHDLHMHAHNAAHAYISSRGPKTAMQVHQQNESKWFLKLDIRDFFPSCSQFFVMQTLGRIYPLSHTSLLERKTFLEHAFHEKCLPQGAVSSPFLSNLVMIPTDYAISASIPQELHQPFVYTRYADDLLISSQYDFDHKIVIAIIKDILAQNTPFEIKDEKTRYGSSAGQNWNLGLMLNKDNNITVGADKKRQLKVCIYNLLSDFKRGIIWSVEDRCELQGHISYIKNIEPAYVKGLISFYETKLGVSVSAALKG